MGFCMLAVFAGGSSEYRKDVSGDKTYDIECYASDCTMADAHDHLSLSWVFKVTIKIVRRKR